MPKCPKHSPMGAKCELREGHPGDHEKYYPERKYTSRWDDGAGARAAAAMDSVRDAKARLD